MSRNRQNQGKSLESKTPEKSLENEYGFVTKKLGGSNFSIKLHLQEREVIGHIVGKLRRGNNKKSNWVDVGSVVLLGMRDFQDKKVDILYVYSPEEVRKLKKSGEIVENVEMITSEVLLDEAEFQFEEI